MPARNIVDDRTVVSLGGRHGTFFSDTSTFVNNKVNGVIIKKVTPYTRVRIKTVTPTYYIQREYGKPNTIFEGVISAPTFPRAQIDSNKMISLYSKLADAARKSDFNGSVALAEARESIKFIGDISTRLAHSIHAVRHGDLYDAFDSLSFTSRNPSWQRNKLLRYHRPKLTYSGITKYMAQRRLEYEYAVKPLVSDAYASGKAAAAVLVKDHSTDFSATVHDSKSGQLSGFFYSSNIRKRLRSSLKSVPQARTIFNLDDPATAAWNILRFSFVVDWILPIGDWLEAMGKNRFLSYNSIMESTKSVTYDSGVDLVSRFGLPLYTAQLDSPFINSVMSFERKVDVPLPRILPLPKFKAFEDALSLDHLLNGLALIRTAVR